jgi:glutamate synthase domain-containing protein 2
MISVGCIQSMKCHTNTCPVGVATTDERLMSALVIEEKQFRVLNYLVTLRAGLTSLAAAAGLSSPTLFERRHAVYKDAHGRIQSAEQLFPTPAR